MGVHVNSEEMEASIGKIEEALWGLDDTKVNLNGCTFPPDGSFKEGFVMRRENLKTLVDSIITNLRNIQTDIRNIKESFENAESRNNSIAGSIGGAGVTGITGGSVSSNYGKATVTTPDTSNSLGDTNIKPEDPTKVEVDDSDKTTNISEEVTESEVTKVIELIYGEDPEIPQDTKERIANAIANINRTEILDGLDEDIANQAKAEIVKDVLDGELEIEGITAEQLQEYIDGEPSIKIHLEMNDALTNFDGVIADGTVTEDQIKSIMNEKIVISDSEEFTNLYIENGGTEAEIADVEFFTDEATQKIYIRDTADSITITKIIVSELDENLFFDEITGNVIQVQNIENIENDVNIEMPGNDINNGNTEDINNANIENQDGNINL